MNIVIFDTETTSLDKPFCYNVGYTVFDTDTETTVLEKDFVVEQIWHNTPLFSSAYYADKRPIYVNAMRSRKTTMKKFGYICQEMIRDFDKFDVSIAYAYNAKFDEKVFNFNCDWFKCCNPFDNVQILDIMGNVHKTIAFTDAYKAFCEKNEFFTESGNYSATAENVYRYLTNNLDFMEEHTALADSEIECEILKHTLQNGCAVGTEYKKYMSIPRMTEKEMTIVIDKKTEHKFRYIKKTTRNGKIYLTTK